jgi:flagella basal body P-ring formation protein FlgA
VLADAGELPKVLERLSGKAVQGTVARSGEVLVLAFDSLGK